MPSGDVRVSAAEIVVCGAGIAGIAAAHELSVRRGQRGVLLIDELPPLSLTSDKSTECYRNWWPGPGDAMVRLMNRSIDRLEELAHECGNLFLMNRRGYLYASAREESAAHFRRAAEEAAALGAGPVRTHTGAARDYRPAPARGFAGTPDGVDIIAGRPALARLFPWLHPDTAVVLHARRCGWLSAQQLGMHLLERARAAGTELRRGRITAIDTTGGRVRSVSVDSASGTERIDTARLVVAAGPHVTALGAQLGLELPIFSERHVKVTFEDRHAVVPREAPLFIWTDPVRLPWTQEEREVLAAEEETRRLLEEFPPGAHGRPLGEGRSLILYWTYDCAPVPPTFPVEWDPHLPEIVVRGMSAMLPGLKSYFGALPRPWVDGGYYTKTRENRPLMGPLPLEGAYIHAAFSGFGIMAAMGAAELLAAHVLGDPLPDHAWAFTLERYERPQYREWLADWDDSGQL